MPAIAIVTDSACDLGSHLTRQHQIDVVPLLVRFGSEMFRDGELSQEAFWERAELGVHHPETSQPSVGDFERAFARWVEHGYEVLCPVISSKISGTFNAAWAASHRFLDKVTVFDTRVWSVAQGYQVLAAARAVAEGLSREEIVARLEDIRERTRVFLAMDTLAYAKRGGRFQAVISAIARVADMLSIKPIIEVVEGQPSLLGLARSMNKAMARIGREIAKHGAAEALMVGHTRIPERAAAFARALAEEIGFPAEQVLISELGPALASHGGPGAIAGGIVHRGAWGQSRR